MKILFTTHPGIGHLHPMVPIANELKASGHQIAFASAARFSPMIENLGFKAFAAGLDWLESEAEVAFPELSRMPLEQQHLWFLTEAFADVTANRMLPDLLSLCESWMPDLIVRDDFEFAGCVAAEYLDIPHAAIGVDLFIPLAMLDSLLGSKLSLLRKSVGLTTHSAVDMLYRYLYITLMPPSYQFADSDPVPVSHALRSLNFDRSLGDELPKWINQLRSQPTAYATLGTAFNRTPEIFRTIIQGLANEAINLIITVGPGQDAAQFDPSPDNIYVETYIPQTLLFPRCDLVILSGSSNSVMTALSYGLPMILIPTSSTQPLHAIRCASLGVGCVLKLPGLFDAYLYNRSYSELSPKSIRSAVNEILQNPIYHENAKRLREEIQSLPGPERAVELLTRLAFEKVPQTA